MTAHLVVLGATAEQLPLVQRVRELGHRVTAVDNEPTNPCHSVAEASVINDLRDLEGLTSSVGKVDPDGVITMASDVAVPAVAHLRRVLGLPDPLPGGLPEMCRKDELARMLESASLPVAPTATDDVLPGPWVVKPTRASGGRGVTVVQDRGSLAEAKVRAAAASLDGRSLVQPYVEGRQLSVEGALTPRSSCLVITRRLVAERPCVTTLGHIAPASLSPAEAAAVRDVVETLFRASGPYTGPVDADVVLQPDGVPVVIDASPRLGGNRLPMLVELVTGWPLVSWAVGRALGHLSEPPHAREHAYVAAGVLGAVQGDPFTWNEQTLPQLTADPAVVDLSVTAEPGRTIGGLTDSRGRVGYAVLCSTSEPGLIAAQARLRPRLADAGLVAPGFDA